MSIIESFRTTRVRMTIHSGFSRLPELFMEKQNVREIAFIHIFSEVLNFITFFYTAGIKCGDFLTFLTINATITLVETFL